MGQQRDERMRNRVVNRLRLLGSAGRAELARVADTNDYRRGVADVDRLLAEGVIQLNGNKYRLADPTPETKWLCRTCQTPCSATDPFCSDKCRAVIPADEPATVAGIPVPAQPFAWTPQVFWGTTEPDGPYTASPGSLRIEILPADPADFWA